MLEKLKGLDGLLINPEFSSKERRFKPQPHMILTDPTILVGPGDHDPERPKRHIGGPKMEYKGDFSIPFNENNPLNYVKPITVNIYFKQQNPCVG